MTAVKAARFGCAGRLREEAVTRLILPNRWVELTFSRQRYWFKWSFLVLAHQISILHSGRFPDSVFGRNARSLDQALAILSASRLFDPDNSARALPTLSKLQWPV